MTPDLSHAWQPKPSLNSKLPTSGSYLPCISAFHTHLQGPWDLRENALIVRQGSGTYRARTQLFSHKHPAKIGQIHLIHTFNGKILPQQCITARQRTPSALSTQEHTRVTARAMVNSSNNTQVQLWPQEQHRCNPRALAGTIQLISLLSHGNLFCTFLLKVKLPLGLQHEPL